MITDEQIARINELYHKSKSVGLSDEELAEQKELRQLYVAAIKSSVRAQMNNIDIVNEDGTISNVGQTHDKKRNNQ